MSHTKFIEERAAGIIPSVEQPAAPYVGMPATYVIGSDQYAGEIVEVSRTGHQVTWVRVFESGKESKWGHRLSRRRDGRYICVGSQHGHLKLGVAKTDLDAGF